MNQVDPVSGTRLEPHAPAGVETRPERTLLAERAVDYLRAGPADARSLIGSVCQLSALPDAVAEHMAATLLGGHPRFVRSLDGRWRLSESAAPAWRAMLRTKDLTTRTLSSVRSKCRRCSRPAPTGHRYPGKERRETGHLIGRQ